MNKLLVKFLILSIVIVLIIVPLATYAMSSNTVSIQSPSSIITTPNEVSPGDELPIKVDISKIEYDSFVLTISSSGANFENVDINTGINITESADTTKVIVEKSNLSVNSLILTYKVPNDAAQKIQLNTEIAEFSKGVKIEGTEIRSTISVSIVAKGSSQNNNNNNKDKEKEIERQEKKEDKNEPQKEKSTNTKNNNTFSQKTTYTIRNTTKSSMPSAERNIYIGSSNNYLKSLKISGYDLMPQFKKTSNTYFLNIGEDISKLKITAKAESSKAKVNIYGNTNLKVGSNKILINVTAEDGEVRTYRIYITKK